MSTGESFGVTTSFKVEECCDCGIMFAVTDDFQRRRLSDKTTFYCPAGHPQLYVGKDDKTLLEEARRQLANEREIQREMQARIDDKNDELAHKDRVINGHKGHAAKLKKRIEAGKCPCCDAEFPDLHAHMAEHHPEYAAPETDSEGDS